MAVWAFCLRTLVTPAKQGRGKKVKTADDAQDQTPAEKRASMTWDVGNIALVLPILTEVADLTEVRSIQWDKIYGDLTGQSI